MKCGSTQVDDGKNALASFIGVCLFVITITIFVTISCCASRPVADWSTYAPLYCDNPVQLISFVVAIALSEIVIVHGLQRWERVRCRKCGTYFTPPKPPKKKLGHEPHHAHMID